MPGLIHLKVGRGNVLLLADVFNLFNTQTALDYNTFTELSARVPNPDFGAAGVSGVVSGQQFTAPPTVQRVHIRCKNSEPNRRTQREVAGCPAASHSRRQCLPLTPLSSKTATIGPGLGLAGDAIWNASKGQLLHDYMRVGNPAWTSFRPTYHCDYPIGG